MILLTSQCFIINFSTYLFAFLKIYNADFCDRDKNEYVHLLHQARYGLSTIISYKLELQSQHQNSSEDNTELISILLKFL